MAVNCGLAGVRSDSCAKQLVLLTWLLFADDVMIFVHKHQGKIWDKSLVSTFVGQYLVELVSYSIYRSCGSNTMVQFNLEKKSQILSYKETSFDLTFSYV